MKKLGIALVLVSATLVAACSSSSSDSGTSGSSGAATPEAGAPTNQVEVSSNKFTPAALTVKVGDTVTWKWAGGAHSVTSGPNCVADMKFNEPVTSENGHTFTHKFDTAGTFEYFCIPHCMSSGMKGTITVQ